MLGQALAPEVASDSEALRQLVPFDDPEVRTTFLRAVAGGARRTLIVLDQFEELFTLNPSRRRRRGSSRCSRGSSTRPSVHVLLSMRDDFLMRCHDHPALAPVFLKLTPLGPLTHDGLRRAVVEPAGKQGYRFEDDELVEEILVGGQGDTGRLPLLAFAVSRLWERRDREKQAPDPRGLP